MGKKGNQKPSGPEAVDPYSDGRREWNERYGSYVTHAKIGWTVGIIGLLCGVGGGTMAAWTSTQNRVVPYVIEMDEDGIVHRLGPAKAVTVENENVTKAFILRQIVNLRSVTADAQVQENRVKDLYKTMLTGSPALAKVTQHFQQEGNSPFERAVYELVDVKVDSVLMLSEKSIEIEWVEISRDKTGNELAEKKYKAVVEIEHKPGETQEELLQNPLGIYIKNIHWSEKAVN